jgi:hypothetical protein
LLTTAGPGDIVGATQPAAAGELIDPRSAVIDKKIKAPTRS